MGTTTSFGVELPSARTVTVQPSLCTKQFGSVLAFGDSKGAATITSTPLQEPKTTPISRPIVERDAWVQSVTPTDAAPFTTLSTIAQPRAVTIQTASVDSTDMRDFDRALFGPPKTTADAPVVLRDDLTIQITVQQDNGTLALSTHGQNATDHKTHHTAHHQHLNYTKTITDMVTKTKNVTATVTTFPQLRTHNSSLPYYPTGSGVSINPNYTRLTHHNAEAGYPTQNAALSNPFLPAVLGISHSPASSPAMHAFEPPAAGSLFLFNIIIVVLGFYLLASGRVGEPMRKQEAPLTEDEQKTAFANLGACAGNPEEAEALLAKLQEKSFELNERKAKLILAELIRRPLSEDDVKAIQKGVDYRISTRNRRQALDKDWRESEKLAAEASVQMWEEEKQRKIEGVSQTVAAGRRNAISSPSTREGNSEVDINDLLVGVD